MSVEALEAPPPTRFGGFVQRAAAWLPKGGALSEDEWNRRHRAITLLLAAQSIGLVIFGLIRGYDLIHILWEALIPMTCAVLARARGTSRDNRAVIATFGLVVVSGIFVHLSGGTIEGHFHFFIMLAVISLYHEWRTFVLAIAFVALHHGVIGTLDPESVYDHAPAIADPWSWALIHATLVLGESVALVVAWRFSELAYERAASSGRRLMEEAQRRREEQLEAQAAIERREAQLEEAQTIARLGSWDWDLATDAVDSTEELLRIFGFDPSAPRPEFETYMDRIHDEDRAVAEEAIRNALETLQPYTTEFRVLRPDGTLAYILASGKVVVGDDGVPARLVGTCQDVTERKLLESRINQSQKMEAVGQLAGGIAHDFNNLLAVISSFGSFALEELPEGDPARADIQQVIDAGKKGANLTRQLLTFSRKEVVKPLVFSPVDVIAETQKLLTRTLKENIDLSTRLSREVWNIKMDRGELEQVLMNLAINAQGAMPKGGSLFIQADNVAVDPTQHGHPGDLSPGEYVRIQVSDTGQGIAEAVRPRIFEPFFTTKGVGDGTGLGLATVYGIVTRAGGGISVYSEVGHGSTFKVYLPRCAEELDESETEYVTRDDLRGNGETILVVEDEEAVLELTVRILSRNGYQVLRAQNGAEALNLIEPHPVDLIVTDVVMPVMSGRELADRAGIKTLFMSGYTNQLIAKQGILAEDEVLVQKPFGEEELLVAVHKVLGEVTSSVS